MRPLNNIVAADPIVTTTGHGADAFGFANDKALEPINGGGLLYLLDSIGRPARIIMPRQLIQETAAQHLPRAIPPSETIRANHAR